MNYSKSTIPYSGELWHVLPGRYHAKLQKVAPDFKNPERSRLVFQIPKQGKLLEDKLAGINYDPKNPCFLERDLKSWFGESGMTKRFPDGNAELSDLGKLIGEEAVLEITNHDRKQERPLVIIAKIFPPKPKYMVEPKKPVEGLKFKFSFASNPSPNDATAA